MRTLAATTGCVILLVLALPLGCGGTSRLIIQHDDPGVPSVAVSVDDEPVGVLQYGQAFLIQLEPGHHRVDVRDVTTDDDGWSDDGQGWQLYIEDEAILTLLEEAPSP